MWDRFLHFVVKWFVGLRFSFVRRIEMFVRQVHNKSLIKNYKGEDLRDVLLVKLQDNDLLDRSWSGMTINIENNKLVADIYFPKVDGNTR